MLSQCKALKNLFQHVSGENGESGGNEFEELIQTLMEKRELYLPGGVNSPVGSWILKLFEDNQNVG